MSRPTWKERLKAWLGDNCRFWVRRDGWRRPYTKRQFRAYEQGRLDAMGEGSRRAPAGGKNNE